MLLSSGAQNILPTPPPPPFPCLYMNFLCSLDRLALLFGLPRPHFNCIVVPYHQKSVSRRFYSENLENLDFRKIPSFQRYFQSPNLAPVPHMEVKKGLATLGRSLP